MKWTRWLVALALVGACSDEHVNPLAPPISANHQPGTQHLYRVFSYTQDSFWVFPPVRNPSGYSQTIKPVQARARIKCPAKPWTAWSLIGTDGFSITWSCTGLASGNPAQIEVELNDSVPGSAGNVVVDSGTSTHVRLKKTLWGSGFNGTQILVASWPQWVAVPYVLMREAAIRAQTKFTYARSVTQQLLPVNVCRYPCPGDGYRFPPFDTAFVRASHPGQPPAFGVDPVNGYARPVGTMLHEMGHAYLAGALHNAQEDACHGCTWPPPDIAESFATFFAAFIGGQRLLGSLPLSYSIYYDDYNQEQNYARTETAINPGQVEMTGAGLLLDMVDTPADSNGYDNEVDGDDDTVNWGAQYIANLMYGPDFGGTGYKTAFHWTNPQGGLVSEYGAKNREDLLIAISVFNISDIPAQWRGAWRLGSGWTLNSVQLYIGWSPPAGWTPSLGRQLWMYDLYNLGSLPVTQVAGVVR